MLLLQEYKSDFLELLKSEPDETFTACKQDKKRILANETIIDSCWISYQKSVQEFNVPTYQAFRQAIETVLGIPEPESYGEED